MRILFLTVGPEIVASSRSRVYQFLPFLGKEGIEAKVINYTSNKYAYKIINNIKINFLDKICFYAFVLIALCRLLFYTNSYRIIFIQKVLIPVPLIKILKQAKKKIIFDFDDAIFLSGIFSGKHKRSIESRFNYILKNSDYIIVSNDFLKKQVLPFNKKVFILTSSVDTNVLLPRLKEKSGDFVKIGWIGSPSSSVYLNEIKRVFEELVRKYKVNFEFIGVGNCIEKNSGFVFKEWNRDSEVTDLQEFDVGIMPLRDDNWCRGKGGYKILQYMAVGIPSVASPVGMNKQIIQEGINGFLAASQEEWIEKLSLLIKSRELREELGRNARRFAEENYCYEIAAPKLIKLFREINDAC